RRSAPDPAPPAEPAVEDGTPDPGAAPGPVLAGSWPGRSAGAAGSAGTDRSRNGRSARSAVAVPSAAGSTVRTGGAP
ncbi:hypothetical protein ACSNN7_29010, partial [Micromonospora sp. URMC 105]|uniref:hypothetical protein n=1 Tax=Micromonospora sp. URMC 105 TaxID=3423413 RepID=UPI003F1BD771